MNTQKDDLNIWQRIHLQAHKLAEATILVKLCKRCHKLVECPELNDLCDACIEKEALSGNPEG